MRFSSELERMLAEKQATTFSQPPGKSNLSLAGSTEQPSEPAWHPSATAEPSADGAAGEGGGLARQSPLTTSGSGIPRPPKHKPSLSLVTMTSLSRCELHGSFVSETLHAGGLCCIVCSCPYTVTPCQ